MKHYKLDNMIKGWFVGNFEPSVLQTNDCEVAVKHYKKGDKEVSHYHRIATEVTVIVSGKVRMLGKEWGSGDIICLSPNEATDFEALADTVTVVVKHPGANNDKYLT